MKKRCLVGRDIWLILLMILCEPCLYFLFETNALNYTTSGQAGIVSSLEPVLLVIGARIVKIANMPKKKPIRLIIIHTALKLYLDNGFFKAS